MITFRQKMRKNFMELTSISEECFDNAILIKLRYFSELNQNLILLLCNLVHVTHASDTQLVMIVMIPPHFTVEPRFNEVQIEGSLGFVSFIM